MKNAQNLLKFGTLDISNIPISILMSKMIFMKYVPAARGRLTSRLKLLKNSCLIFDVFWILTAVSDKSFFIEHLPQVVPKLVLKSEFQSQL